MFSEWRVDAEVWSHLTGTTRVANQNGPLDRDWKLYPIPGRYAGASNEATVVSITIWSDHETETALILRK